MRPQVICDRFELGVTPVIAPVSLGAGSNFNLNADPVTSAIAPAIAANQVVFISNVAGVLVDGALMPSITRAQAQAFIEGGVIAGGMIPKALAALDVLSAGIPEAVITDLDGWSNNGGTTFIETER